MDTNERVGIMLINTGTTAAPEPGPTRRYLREFLSDPRVLDAPAPIRWAVLNLFILPFRPRKSAEAYAAIWTDEGSPLLAVSERQKAGIQERLPGAQVEVAMRYGAPSIASALERLLSIGPERLIVAPLFPQYASASNGSALELVYTLCARKWNVPAVSALPAFYHDEGFLNAWVQVAHPVLEEFRPDHVLFSYHGLPERHVLKSDASGAHCLRKDDCCAAISSVNQYCYRAQCLFTSRELARRLGLAPDSHSTSFQSRLGREPWLAPATDEVVPELARSGIRRLAVMCPAFVTDCLETLEEIGIRAKESFIEAGGEDMRLVPCLNDHPVWLDALAHLLRRL